MLAETRIKSTRLNRADLVDLTGNGLPDLVELGGHHARYWENLGGGTFSAAVAGSEPIP